MPNKPLPSQKERMVAILEAKFSSESEGIGMTRALRMGSLRLKHLNYTLKYLDCVPGILGMS